MKIKTGYIFRLMPRWWSYSQWSEDPLRLPTMMMYFCRLHTGEDEKQFGKYEISKELAEELATANSVATNYLPYLQVLLWVEELQTNNADTNQSTNEPVVLH